MKKPLVVVPGLVRKDALAYLSEHVEIKQWTETNIDWATDFNAETTQHLTDNNLLQYLLW